MLNWDLDFSYNYFKRIMEIAEERFELHTLSEASTILEKQGKPKLILRHDVDVSLKRAVAMATIEKNLGIRSTYMVMPESTLYCIREDYSRFLLQELVKMGHEIAVHIIPPQDNTDSLEEKIDSSCMEVKNVIGLPVKSYSFHQPPKKYQWISPMQGTRINAYSKEFKGYYKSDSGGRWQDGEPLSQLLGWNEPYLQLLTHPIWWGERHMPKEERLHNFWAEETSGRPTEEAEKFKREIMKTISVKFQ